MIIKSTFVCLENINRLHQRISIGDHLKCSYTISNKLSRFGMRIVYQGESIVGVIWFSDIFDFVNCQVQKIEDQITFAR